MLTGARSLSVRELSHCIWLEVAVRGARPFVTDDVSEDPFSKPIGTPFISSFAHAENILSLHKRSL